LSHSKSITIKKVNIPYFSLIEIDFVQLSSAVLMEINENR
jgi:hypothetical protein